MSKPKILFAGESWFVTTIETKGFDQFTIGGYETEIHRIYQYMGDAAEIIHMPAHEILEKFPGTAEELAEYDMVIISDVGANTFFLHPQTFKYSIATPNRLEAIKQYVANGGSFGMMGGYLSFTGFEAKAHYHDTALEEILPVEMLPCDDRKEHPEGFSVEIDPDRHPILNGFPKQWPALLGYNKLIAKPDADVIVEYDGDPILALGTYGKGKTFAWASDCAPHWMSPEFCEWEYNKKLWENIIAWATK